MAYDIESSNKFEELITAVLKLPIVKVDREEFLRKIFKKHISGEKIEEAIKYGTVDAGISINVLEKEAKGLMNTRTNQSTAASVLAGIPGGITILASVPADVLQFFAVSLRAAQELAYIYGYKDFWDEYDIDEEKVRNELIVFLGVMFGVSGANTTLRLMTNAMSKQVLKQLPKKALTKTIYYPIIKKISARIGINITKSSFAKSVSKVIPVVGGVVSGGLTYFTMKPMLKRLDGVLKHAIKCSYTKEEIKKDINNLEKETGEKVELDINGSKVESNEEVLEDKKKEGFNLTKELERLKEVLDSGMITYEQYEYIKNDLIEKSIN